MDLANVENTGRGDSAGLLFEGSSPLVLIAEDMGIQVRLTQICLQRAGFTVIAAQNGLEALAKAQAEIPDVILLDVDMPGMNGFQVLDKLRSQDSTRAIPVIMLTAHAKDSGLFDEWATNGDTFLTKPFNPLELIATVKKSLSSVGK